MKRLSLCVSLTLIFISLAFASDPVQLNPLSVEKAFEYPFKGQWLPDADPLYVGVENYVTLQNMRYTDSSLETVEGYSKITSSAMSETPVSGFHFKKDDESHVLTKALDGSSYRIFDNSTAIPSTGDYTSTAVTTTNYETITLDSNPGFYSDGPGSIFLYGDTTGAYWYGGESIDPESILLSTSSGAPLSNYIDYTRDNINLNGTFDVTSSNYIYIGSYYRVKGFTVDVSSPNVSSSSLAAASWTGASWATPAISSDGTASGGITFAQDGDVYISQTVAPQAYYLGGYVLYWYRLKMSAGSATLNSIKLITEFGPIEDFWNGSGRTCIAFYVQRDTTAAIYTNYTYQVASASTYEAPYAATVGGIGTSSYIFMMFEEPIMGINVKMLDKLVNTTSTEISSISVWTGSSYTTISNVVDSTEKSSGDTTLFKSGVISWPVTTSVIPRQKDEFGVVGYSYRIALNGSLRDARRYITSSSASFSGSTCSVGGAFYLKESNVQAGETIVITGSTYNDGKHTLSDYPSTTSFDVTGSFITEGTGASIVFSVYDSVDHDGTSIDTVTGIAAPVTISGHNGVGFYGGRVMLIDGNKVDYSLPDNPGIFNGVNTSNEGNPNPIPLYFGEGTGITSTHSLSNRYGSNIIELWAVTKNNETYSLTGSQPYSDANDPFIIKKMSSSIGCPAPMTMKEVQVTFEGIQRNALMWLDSSGPVIFDGAVVDPVKGIENYFDPTKSEYIKTSLISKSTAYYDSTNHEYNLLFPSGSSATANNKWMVYDLRRQKWYEKVPASYPIYTIEVEDTDGAKYSYGQISSGHLMRLDNTQAWDSAAINQEIRTGYFIPPMKSNYGLWEYSEMTSVKLLSESTSEDADVNLNVYGDGNAASIFTQINPLDASDGIARLTKNLNQMRLKKYMYQLRFLVSTDTDKWHPLFYGYKARYLRED